MTLALHVPASDLAKILINNTLKGFYRWDYIPLGKYTAQEFGWKHNMFVFLEKTSLVDVGNSCYNVKELHNAILQIWLGVVLSVESGF